MDDLRPVLLYDGHCRFCIAQAERLARWTGNRIRLLSFREPGVLARHPALTPEACEQAMQLVLPDGRIAAGAEAAARALALRAWLAPLAGLYFVPGIRQLADAGYRLVARNRFRLGGKVCTEKTCGLHEPR
jgi:predicted DCC family thiol-disulfide oxidoreductase YuxK